MKNQIYYGDNLEVLRNHIPSESVDLCYIDPPFNSNRNYNQIYLGLGEKVDQKAQAQAFIDTWTWDDSAEKGFSEIISNDGARFTQQSIKLIAGLELVLGKSSLFTYLITMTLRINEIQRVLKPTGSFYLHCDPTASHYLKLVCDAIFCPRGGDFRNEIIWCYTGGGRSKNDFAHKHDSIFRYAKGKEVIFNADAVRVSYNLDASKYSSPKAWGSHKGSSKEYAPNPLGKVPEDWWQLSPINSQSKERLGYPTQKPETLLERIIQASSNEGDVVLDAFCGCGTTIAVAHRLKRNWIGIDITYQAITVILHRLKKSFSSDFKENVADKTTANVIENVNIHGVPKDINSAIALATNPKDKARKEFEKWFVLEYSQNRAAINDKKGGDGGVDGEAYIYDVDSDGKKTFRKVILQVKSNVVVSPSVIRDLVGTIEGQKGFMGILLTLYQFPALKAECKKYGQVKIAGATYPKIQVVCVEEMLNGITMNLPNVAELLKKAEQKSLQINLDGDL
jgi:DNA modification methylase